VSLVVHNAAGKMSPIPQLLVIEACQTLGVRFAPDGNNDAKFEHLMQIASEWFMAMKAGQ